MRNKEYDLDFYEAFKIVMEGGCVKGDDFINGIYLKLNSRGRLVIVDAGDLYSSTDEVFLKGMVRQKFRKLTVLTKKELSQ